ncbi:hypothetical protein NP277_23785, partial [Salmonella enterica]|nr:hypothetical protein [Salmonella enterica]
SLKTSIKTITYLSDIGCLEIQGASLIPFMEPLSRVSWFVGVIVAFVAYALLKKRTGFENTGEQKLVG